MDFEVRPTYLIMVTEQNNNKFYNAFPDSNGTTFTVKYGRVGGTEATTSYSMLRWNAKLSEKVKKGYKDITSLKSALVEEVSRKTNGYIEDDEYNCADLKFIFGIPCNDTETPSFSTLNKFTIYYSKLTRLYYIDINIDYLTELTEISDKLIEFMNKKNLSILYHPDEFIEQLSYFDLSGKTLEELYSKFDILVKGMTNDVQV